MRRVCDAVCETSGCGVLWHTHVANGGFAASVVWPQQYATLVYDKAESDHP